MDTRSCCWSQIASPYAIATRATLLPSSGAHVYINVTFRASLSSLATRARFTCISSITTLFGLHVLWVMNCTCAAYLKRGMYVCKLWVESNLITITPCLTRKIWAYYCYFKIWGETQLFPHESEGVSSRCNPVLNGE